MRYEGTFDWLAIGDDDTVFMYNRAKEFLRHINHTQVRVMLLSSVILTWRWFRRLLIDRSFYLTASEQPASCDCETEENERVANGSSEANLMLNHLV